MKVVVAIDSFKGCLSSQEANRAAAEGIRSTCPDVDVVQVPVSDGGEGFLDAFRAAVGGTLVMASVRDPLMRPVMAKYLLCGETAVIEIAQASGLTLLKEEERNPLIATSYGTGQLVADAVSRGARQIIVGLGGSATSDAGRGMLEALMDALEMNGTWDNSRLKDVRFTIASDVRNPLCGPNGAAHIFAPQKGATQEEVLVLDERARAFAEYSARLFGYDCSLKPGAGAAGGLGYAFMQYMDAECVPGIQLLLQTIKFDELVRDADLVITGEGSADGQTLMGKLPMGVLGQAAGVPVCLIAGRVNEREELIKAGFARVESINPTGMALEDAMRKEVAMRNIGRTCSTLLLAILRERKG